MVQKNQKISLLAVIWNRIKYALGNEPKETGLSPGFACRVRFLERCLVEDCWVEKTRKQLERQWQDVAPQNSASK